MNVTIYDHYRTKKLVDFTDVAGLSFSKELPGGCISADFVVPIEYDQHYPWADFMNQVDMLHDSERVWAGLVHGVSRNKSESEAQMGISAVGWTLKLAGLEVSTDLSNEKGSTYLNDHIVSASALEPWIKGTDVQTHDYSIPGTFDVPNNVPMIEVIEWINKFNGWDWGIDEDRIFFFRQPVTEKPEYIVDEAYWTGGVTQDISEWGNRARVDYTNLSDVASQVSVDDDESEYPLHGKWFSISQKMNSTQATQYANIALGECSKFGTSQEIEVKKIKDIHGKGVHPSEVEIGKLVHIRGLVPAVGKPSEIYGENDINTFRIMSMHYNDDGPSVSISPGKIASRLEVLLNRLDIKSGRY